MITANYDESSLLEPVDSYMENRTFDDVVYGQDEDFDPDFRTDDWEGLNQDIIFGENGFT